MRLFNSGPTFAACMLLVLFLVIAGVLAIASPARQHAPGRGADYHRGVCKQLREKSARRVSGTTKNDGPVGLGAGPGAT